MSDVLAAGARERLEHFIKYRRFATLSRALLADLVERIEVSEGGRISILFRYREELAALEAPPDTQ